MLGDCIIIHDDDDDDVHDEKPNTLVKKVVREFDRRTRGRFLRKAVPRQGGGGGVHKIQMMKDGLTVGVDGTPGGLTYAVHQEPLSQVTKGVGAKPRGLTGAHNRFRCRMAEVVLPRPCGGAWAGLNHGRSQILDAPAQAIPANVPGVVHNQLLCYIQSLRHSLICTRASDMPLPGSGRTLRAGGSCQA